jgi:hypothetical protein
MNADIVTRLRDIEGGYGFRAICGEAASEIERLRNDLDGSRLAYRGASFDRDRMRAERDEARREVCRIWADRYGSVGLVAERRGWDCFKEARDDR